jgi:BASS family bile acid:Na+ symporter
MKSFLDVGVLSLTVFAMLSVGLELEIHRFRQLTKHIVALAMALLVQIILIPTVGLLVSYGLDLSPTLRSGILLVAACPVGDIANFFTLIGRGNLAVSVAYNAISCLISPLSMTIVFAGYSRILGTPFAFAAPGWRLVLPFFFLITVPIVAGVGLRFTRTPKIDRISRSLRFSCLVGVFALCAYVIVSRFSQLKADWKFAASASALLALAAIIIGWTVSRVLRMERADSLALLISFAVRNVGLATAIAITIMSRTEYAVFSTVYFLSEVVFVLGAVVAFRTVRQSSGKLQLFGFTTKVRSLLR